MSHTNSKENVWCGVTSEKVYGPFFFEEETVRAVNYLDMIEQYVVPQLQQDRILDTIIYQQDGAPPHWAIIVRKQLNHIFNDRWCGRDGPIPWPPNIPDLTPPDFLYGATSSRQCTQKRSQNLADLWREIAAAFQQITPEMLRATWRNMESRFDLCCVRNGGHVEC